MLLNDRYVVRKERRQVARRSSRLEGWIKFDGAFAARRCAIRNLSPQGALITGVASQAVSHRFRLGMSREDQAGKRCEVIWRQADMIGVRFL